MRLLYYALGGGHGHVMRGLALLSRLGHGTLLGPARLAGWARALGVDYLAPPEPYAPAWIETVSAPDFLLVDVVPRGVLAELPPLLARTPAWLVTRLVSHAYYLHPPVRAALAEDFEHVVWTEPAPELRALAPRTSAIPPVLLQSTPLTKADARRELGVPTDRRLLLGIGSGDREQQTRVCRLLEKLCARLDVTLRFVSAELPPISPVVDVFPASRVLAGADVIVAAGGYHTVHEIRAAGVPAVFLPQRRRYDEQWRRVAGRNIATDPYALETLVQRLLIDGRVAPESVGDGAGMLARLVERRVQEGVLPEEEITAVA